MNELFGHRLGGQLEGLLAALLHLREPHPVDVPVRRILHVDIAAVGLYGVLDEPRGDRPRLNQGNMDATAGELDTQHVGQSLDCELRGTIGAAIAVSYTHLTLPTKRIV